MGSCARTVLVVEDERDSREALCDLLDDAGFKAVGVSEGQAALDLLDAGADDVCLILLDLMIPFGLDGWRFREAQRASAAHSRIPVVLVSAVHDLAAQAAAVGATGFLAKPLDARAVLETVRRHCAPTSGA